MSGWRRSVAMPDPAPPGPSAHAEALLTWMAAARRNLPWRRRRDAYAVWVSEVMLQQTQVTTVIPYFERWLARYPDISSLAAAPLDDVLVLWEGLGYYARARNLHRAAQIVVASHDGRIPPDRGALLALPGVGRYTAGAILSLAFGLPEPVLDGNVRRVLCRLYDIAEDPHRPAVAARLWGEARALVDATPAGRAGDLNEALMELGALVCTPRAPRCTACPLQATCRAHAAGTQQQRPARRARPRIPHHLAAAAVISDRSGRILIVRRRDEGLLGGLWGFPGGLALPDETAAACAVRTVREMTGIDVQAAGALASIRHAYTHFRITLHAFRCSHLNGRPQAHGCREVRWARLADLRDHGFAVTDRRIADLLMQAESEQRQTTTTASIAA